jgi:hypothetical protein
MRTAWHGEFDHPSFGMVRSPWEHCEDPSMSPLGLDKAVITRADMDAARDLWVHARRDAVYEHRNLSLLVAARKDAIEIYDEKIPIESSPRIRTSHYRSSLGHAVARVQAALDHLDKMAMNFDAIKARWEETERARLSAVEPSRVIYPTTIIPP